MKLVALVSGGKDSCYNMEECVRRGHEIVCLANLAPPASHPTEEMDSFTFQTVGHTALDVLASAMGLPLYRRTIMGSAATQEVSYEPTHGDEVEDLFALLQDVKRAHPDVEGVSCGAIWSDYQRLRVENVCSRLDLTSVAYLWHREQRDLLHEIIEAGVHAIVIKVAWLVPTKHLGRTLQELEPHLHRLHNEFGMNVCGEGGEYETFVLDCSLFTKRVVLDATEVVTVVADPIAPVAYMRLMDAHLETKPLSSAAVCSRVYETEDNDTEEEEKEGAIAAVWEVRDQKGDDNDGEEEGAAQQRNEWIPFVSGEIGMTSHPAACVEEELSMQMTHIGALLRDRGLSWRDVYYVSLYVRDMSLFSSMNRVYSSFMAASNPPSRTCVQIPMQKGHVALECWASVSPRRVLHVQSISCWAPACIGPYSQCSEILGLVFTAGNIGLDPSTMRLVSGVRQQSERALCNLESTLAVLDSSITNSVRAVAFVTCSFHANVARSVWEDVLRKTGHEKTMAQALTLLVVPALPRFALVEYQIVAFPHHLRQRWQDAQFLIGNGHWIALRKHFCAAFCTPSSVPQTFPSISLPLALEEVLDVCHTALRQAELPWSGVQTFRLFYVYGSVSDSSLRRHMRHLSPLSSMASFIPVTAVGTIGAPFGVEMMAVAHADSE